MKKNENVKNVYELAQERLAVLFKEFDNIYVSFSGGKDSGVLLNLCIDYIRRNNLKIKLGVFFMDYVCWKPRRRILTQHGTVGPASYFFL